MATLHAAMLALALSGGDTVLLDFYADWCGPCRQMDPVVERLQAAGYPVRKVNLDQERQLAARFQVTSVPCFVLLVDGHEVKRLVGAQSQKTLETMLAATAQTPLTTAQRPSGSAIWYLSKYTPATAPTNMLTTEPTRLCQFGLVPPASDESAPRPASVSVRTVVGRSRTPIFRTVALRRPIAIPVTAIMA